MHTAHRDAARRAEALPAVADAPFGQFFAILRQPLATLGADSPGAESTSHAYAALFRLMPEEGRTEVLAEIIEKRDRRALLDVLPVVADGDLGAAIAGLDMFRATTPDSPAGRSIYGGAMVQKGEAGTLEQQVLAGTEEVGRLERVGRQSSRIVRRGATLRVRHGRQSTSADRGASFNERAARDTCGSAS